MKILDGTSAFEQDEFVGVVLTSSSRAFANLAEHLREEGEGGRRGRGEEGGEKREGKRGRGEMGEGKREGKREKKGRGRGSSEKMKIT